MPRETKSTTDAGIKKEDERPSPKDKALQDAIEKEIAEAKERSVKEKRDCSLLYRRSLQWSGIESQEQFDKKYRDAAESYRTGNFFFERIGRYRDVDLSLTLAVMNMRSQWIEEYEITTTPEFMLLDMAITSYFHFLRLNEQVNNIMANIEWEMFALDAPSYRDGDFYQGLTGKKKDRAVAERLAYRLQEILQPILDQFNRAFIRNLKALRDLRRGNIQLNIGNVGQMNIGDRQINVEKPFDKNP